MQLMGVEGPRHSTESKQKQQFGQNLTHKAPHGLSTGGIVEADKTAELMAIWVQLSESERDALLAMVQQEFSKTGSGDSHAV